MHVSSIGTRHATSSHKMHSSDTNDQQHQEESKFHCHDTCYREASERQVAIERRKRAEIEARKAQELQQERSQIDNWQQSLASGGQQQQQEQEEQGQHGLGQLGTVRKTDGKGQQLADGGWRLGTGLNAGEGDESDYEDTEDGDDDQEIAARDQGVVASSLSQQQQERLAGVAGGASDHEHYYGRGWRAQASHAEAANDHSNACDGGSDSEQSAEDEQCSDQEEEEAACEDAPEAGRQVAECAEQAAVPVRAALAAVKVSFTATESPHLPARCVHYAWAEQSDGCCSSPVKECAEHNTHATMTCS